MEWILLGHVRFGQTFFYPFKFLKERSLYTAVALISYHILFLDIVLRCSLRKFISSLFSFPQDVKNKRLRSEQIFRWVIPPQPQSYPLMMRWYVRWKEPRHYLLVLPGNPRPFVPTWRWRWTMPAPSCLPEEKCEQIFWLESKKIRDFLDLTIYHLFPGNVPPPFYSEGQRPAVSNSRWGSTDPRRPQPDPR